MKRYELKLVDGGKGVFKVSVVKDPAIESTLVYFSKEKEEVTMFADEEKKVIYSVVMRPDLDIFRKNIDGEPANVYYTKETVEKAQINYFRQNGNSATNINHSEIADADGIFPFESWIVSDAKTDRALKFGLDIKDGDWIMGLKVDNDELWKEHIKTGKLDGFSVEATNINYELKEDTKMNTEKTEKKGVVAFIKDGLEKLFGEAEKFEGQVAEVNKWWNTVMNDTFEIGDIVLRKPYETKEKGAVKEEPKPIGAGEYELKDGSRILTDSDGVIRYKTAPLTPAPTPAPAEPTAAPAAPATPAATQMAAEAPAATPAVAAPEATPAAATPATPLTDEEIKALQAENADLKAQLATLKAEKVKADTDLATMKTEKEAVDAKLVTMSRQTPAAQFVKDLPSAPETKEYKDMTNAEKMRFNRENKKY